MSIKLILFTTLLLLSSSPVLSISSANESLFRERVKEVLRLRKEKMLNNVAKKINTSYEDVKKNISFESNNDEYSILGHVLGTYGVCEIKGKITITETQVAGRCISKDNKISIIWP